MDHKDSQRAKEIIDELETKRLSTDRQPVLLNVLSDESFEVVESVVSTPLFRDDLNKAASIGVVTPLAKAIQNEDKRVFVYLLKNNDIVKSLADYGRCIDKAVLAQNVDALKILLTDYRFDPLYGDSNLPIISAIHADNMNLGNKNQRALKISTEILELLLEDERVLKSYRQNKESQLKTAKKKYGDSVANRLELLMSKKEKQVNRENRYLLQKHIGHVEGRQERLPITLIGEFAGLHCTEKCTKCGGKHFTPSPPPSAF